MSSILLQTLARLVGANLGADAYRRPNLAANHPYNGSQYILVEHCGASRCAVLHTLAGVYFTEGS